MATSGEMVLCIAEAMALPKATVTNYHRVLRDAGLVTKGGRGRSATHMKDQDVARLLITIMGSDCLEEAPAVCRLMCNAVFSGPDEEVAEEISRSINLEEAVIILLAQAGRENHQERLQCRCLPLIGHATDDAVFEVSASHLEACISDRSVGARDIRGEKGDIGEESEFSQRIGRDTILEFQCLNKNSAVIYPDDWSVLAIDDRLVARSLISGLRITRLVDMLVLRRVAALLK